MKIIVISLVSSVKRRAAAKKQLDALGLEYEFLDAVDGRTSNHFLLNRYDEKGFLIHYGRPASRGELGCYASHYLIWQRCAESNESVLVLEDDFLLSDKFTDALTICDQLIMRYGFIRLQPTTKSKSYLIKTIGAFSLVKFTKAPQATLCYVLSPAVARKFINKSLSFAYPVDVFIRHFWLHKVPLFGLTPYTADAGELAVDSIIGTRAKVKKSLSVVLQRFYFKGYVQLMTMLENFKYRIKMGS